MKFICNQQSLAKALNIVSKAVTTRTTLPILKGILLEVTEDKMLKMAASDLDITIEEKIDIFDSTPGSVVVQAKLFSDIIRKLPNAPVSVSLEEGNHVKIKCLNSDFSIIGLSSDEFPKIEEEAMEEKITLPAETLKEAIRKVSYAASTDYSRRILTGILLEAEENKLNFVAIDGYRVAIAEVEINNTIKKNVIIDAKIMNEISKILEENVTVEVIFNKSTVTFKTTNIKIIVKMIDGEYVQYKPMIQKDYKTKTKINREKFKEATERAAILKQDAHNPLKIKIKDQKLIITSKSEAGSIMEEIIIEKEGENLEIGFNSSYLLDALNSVNDNEITLLLKNSLSPMHIEIKNGEAMLLPLRLPK